ncbi:growth/differentiation factor 8-like isoform X1 [Aphis gossypii]|uniref:growth/differentiation factor 8-like isoform X1 n=2 Tax=Aphis gossypii TaxID=80765 RepID=UPI002158E313|nr:growth/differentiation factor 8-like isoform X1 [Aphis gossypii]XP_027854240.2 growth/differentiation factor 8-like isoform X1 [Aphis gossypii]XP_027854241.2 growth/differentiation factor 8-like isoform X1 [Aphis gossypii]
MPHKIVVAIFLLITGQTVLATNSTDRQQDSNSDGDDGGMKSMNIELIKLSILNKLGMQRPPEFGNRLSLQGQLKKYNNNSGSSTVTLPQFRNRSYRINVTGNDTIDSHNGDDDDDYHVQTQKLIAFTQPHPTMQNFQGQFPLYFTFSDPTRHYSITKAILWVYKRQLLDVIIEDSVIIIDVYKIDANNLQQSLVSSVKQVFNTTEPGWVPIELQRNMSDWLKTVDGTKNLTLVVQAYYLNKNTTHDKMPYITDARKREDNMTEVPYLEVHTHNGYRNKRESRSGSSTCSRHPVMIDFSDIGWDWILAPRRFTFYYCLGECSPSIPVHFEVELQTSAESRCCVPRKTSNFTVLHTDRLGNIFSSVIPYIIVDECG